MNVESVSYISASGSVLFFFFGILALLLSFKDKLSLSKLFFIPFLLLLSMLTKETGFLFVILLLLSMFLFKKKQSMVLLLSSSATILYLFIRFATIGMQYTKQEFIPIMKLSFTERLINIPQIVLFYLQTFFFPDKLAISQNWIVKNFTFTNFYFPFALDLLFFISVSMLGLYFYKQDKKNFKIFIFSLIWFVLGMGMLTQVVPLDMTVADRWMYFPMIGLLGIIGTGIYSLQKRTHISNRVVFTIFIILISLFSLRTIVRNTNWSDAITLYAHDVQIQDDYNKEDGLGVELISNGLSDQALPHIEKSVALNPYYANINDLGVIYQHKGDIQKAKKYYTEATQMKTYKTASPYINLVTLLVLYDDPKLAIPIIKNTLLANHPNTSRFWVLLAVGEYKLHNQREALIAAKNAYTLSVDQQTTYIYDLIQNKQPIESINNKSLE